MKLKHIILAGLTTAILVAGIFLVIVYGFGGLQRGTADFRGETSEIEQTKANGSYRIAAYEKFFDKCAGIQSLESKIDNMEEELEDADKQRVTVLNASITASKNKRSEMIASYNADARKEDTQGQFKASDLPYKIDENEGRTLCEAY